MGNKCQQIPKNNRRSQYSKVPIGDKEELVERINLSDKEQTWIL